MEEVPFQNFYEVWHQICLPILLDVVLLAKIWANSEKTPNFVVIALTADGLAPIYAMTSPVTVM